MPNNSASEWYYTAVIDEVYQCYIRLSLRWT